MLTITHRDKRPFIEKGFCGMFMMTFIIVLLLSNYKSLSSVRDTIILDYSNY